MRKKLIRKIATMAFVIQQLTSPYIYGANPPTASPPKPLRAKAQLQFTPIQIRSGELNIAANESGTIYVKMPQARDHRFYRRLLISESLSHGNTDKFIEQLKLFAISRKQHIFLYDPNEIAGHRANASPETADNAIDFTANFIATAGGIGSLVSGQPELGVVTGIAATGVSSLKSAAHLMYDPTSLPKYKGQQFGLEDGANEIQRTCESLSQSDCTYMLSLVDDRHQSDESKGEFNLAVAEVDNLMAKYHNLETRQDQQQYQLDSNNLNNEIWQNPTVKSLINERIREQAAKKLETQIEREKFEGDLQISLLRNFMNAGSIFLKNENDKRRFGAIAEMSIGILSAQLARNIQIGTAKKLAIDEGKAYTGAAEKSISANYYLTCALLVFNAYEAWSSSSAENDALAQIGRQLQALDEKLTFLITMSEQNFREIKKALAVIDKRTQLIDDRLILGQYKDSILGRSLNSATEYRHRLVAEHVNYILNSDKSVRIADVENHAQSMLNMIGLTNLDLSASSNIFAGAVDNSAKEDIGASLSLLMNSGLVSSEQFAFDELGLMASLSHQIFTYYLKKTASDKSNVAAQTVLRQSESDLRAVLQNGVPNLGSWYALAKSLAVYNKNTSHGLSDSTLNRTIDLGNKIKLFYDKTLTSTWFQSGMRYSLSRAYLDVVKARNDFWNYATMSYLPSVGTQDDILKFDSVSIDVTRPIKMYWPGFGLDPNDDKANNEKFKEQMFKRLAADPQGFEVLRSVQLARLLSPESNIKFVLGGNACTYNWVNPYIALNTNSSGGLFNDVWGSGSLSTVLYGEYMTLAPDVRCVSNKYLDTASINLPYPKDETSSQVQRFEMAFHDLMAVKLQNGTPVMNFSASPNTEAYFYRTIDTAANSLSSPYAAGYAQAYYQALDRYIITYYTARAFLNLQNSIAGDFNLKCNQVIYLPGLAPQEFIAALSTSEEKVTLDEPIQEFLKASFDANAPAGQGFACLGRAPEGINLALRSLTEMAKHNHSWF